MDGKAERRWLGTVPCDNERTIALRKNALRAYEEKFSELMPPGPWLRVGTVGIDYYNSSGTSIQQCIHDIVHRAFYLQHFRHYYYYYCCNN